MDVVECSHTPTRGARDGAPFFVQVGPIAPILHYMIEILVIVSVVALVVTAFMVVVGWSAS